VGSSPTPGTANTQGEAGGELLSGRVDEMCPAVVPRRFRDRRDKAASVPFVSFHHNEFSICGTLVAGMPSNVSEREDPWPAKPAPVRFPVQVTSFVGRARELAELEAIFETARLITITGPGGSGKTRLAFEFASRRAGASESAHLVELAPIAVSDLVPGAIAAAIGVREVAGEDLMDTLIRRLGHRQAVLLIDNLEHLPEAGAAVAQLLTGTTDLRIIATSRAPLHVRGEQEYPLAPLRLSDAGEAASVDALADVEAIRLFVERARAIRPGFELTDENASAVAGICTRLDGLPLAIELAAARIRFLGPEALLARLDRALPVLTGAPMDAPTRQRTLRSTIEWSYDLLDEDGRRAFAAVGVFAGPFTQEAAEAVIVHPAAGSSRSGDPGTGNDVLTSLEHLVDQSVLVAVPTPDDEPRFRLLSTIREFAWDQVVEADRVELHDRHLAYFVARARAAEEPLRGPRQARWMRRLAAEQADIRAALAWAKEAHRDESLVRLVSSLRRRFWYEAGGLREGSQWLDAAIDASAQALPALRARLLQRAAWVVWELGDAERAEVLFKASLAAADEDDHLTRFEALIGLTYRAMGAGGPELEVAAARMDEAIEYARRSGTPGALVEPLTAQGKLAEARGDWDGAKAYFDEALDMARAAGDAWGAASALLPLGSIALSAGEPSRALPLLEESADRATESGDREVFSHATATLARSLVALGEFRDARSRLRDAAAVAFEILNPLGDMFLLEAAAAWLAAVSSWPAAAEAWAAAAVYRTERPWAERPEDVRARRRSQEAARDILGAVRFERAWAAGTTRHVRDAVQAAMAAVDAVDLGDLPATSTTPRRRGKFDLTPREQEVLALVASGMSDGEIAESLVISKKTASVHVANIKSKLGASSRIEIATIALRDSLT
jgi:predicted ATPase/DNA-binding CsgD family transcriptional regulator